jgi:hypothetical protein
MSVFFNILASAENFADVCPSDECAAIQRAKSEDVIVKLMRLSQHIPIRLF